MCRNQIDIENIVGLPQIAERLNICNQTVDNWIRGVRAKNQVPFPEPITVVSARTRIWDWLEVKEWYENYTPLKGGRPTGDKNRKRTKLFVGTNPANMVQTDQG